LSNSAQAGIDSAVQTDGRPEAPVRPWWLGIGIIAIGVVWLYGALSLPQTAQYARIGPGLFVAVIGVALIVLGALLIMQIWQGEVFTPQDSEDALAGAPADKTALLTAIAAAALPLLTIRTLGFPLTAMLSFTLVARAFGSRRVFLDLLIGAILSIIAFFGFVQLGVTLGEFFPLLNI
jgi:putative tricarboxylic transport membrane protein